VKKTLTSIVISLLKTPFEGPLTDGPGVVLHPRMPGYQEECICADCAEKRSLIRIKSSITYNPSSTKSSVSEDGMNMQTDCSVCLEGFKCFAPHAMIQRHREKMKEESNKEQKNKGKDCKICKQIWPDYNSWYTHQCSGQGKIYTTDGNEYGSKVMKDEQQGRMRASATGGLRDNKGKPRLSLVPPSLRRAVARVIYKSSEEAGGKYPMHNWRKGMPMTEVADSLQRHMDLWLEGENLDKETQLHHFDHIACNIAFLIEYLATHPEFDDRYKKETK
jgi:hypothetical protein